MRLESTPRNLIKVSDGSNIETSKNDDYRTSFAEACMAIVKYLAENQDKLSTPNNIAKHTNINRLTVEKAIKFLVAMQSAFYDKYSLNVEEMNSNRKVVGISKRRKLSEYPVQWQIKKLKEEFPDIRAEEIDGLFMKH